MRTRAIKPGFFKNDALAECSPLARILFAGLWCLADREGRLPLRPKRIKAEILPYDDCSIMELLDQLYERHFIIVYKTNEDHYIEIPNFIEHQHCHIKEPESTIPAPDKTDTCTVLERPITFYLLPTTIDSNIYNNKDSSNNISCSSTIQAPYKHRTRTRQEPDKNSAKFEEFYSVYPRKQSKQDALRAWEKLNPDEELFQTIMDALASQKQSASWTQENGKYIPLPATWINGKRWEDELKSPYTPPDYQETPIVTHKPKQRSKLLVETKQGIIPLDDVGVEPESHLPEEIVTGNISEILKQVMESKNG